MVALLVSLPAGTLGASIGVRQTRWIAVVGRCASGLWLLFSPLPGMRDFPRSGTGTRRPSALMGD